MPEVLTASIKNAIDRVKSAMGDPQARLAAATAEVARLQSERKRIEREIVTQQFSTLKKCAAHSTPPMGLHTRTMAAIPGAAWNEFTRQNPRWRGLLQRMCAVKLAIAQADYDAAEKRTREELVNEGFSENEIMDHPRMRRARRALGLWRGLAEACASERDGLSLWKHAMKQLQISVMA